jgi:hypothetical protein
MTALSPLVAIPPVASRFRNKADATRAADRFKTAVVKKIVRWSQAEFTDAGGAGFGVEKQIDGLLSRNNQLIRARVIKHGEAGSASISLYLRSEPKTGTFEDDLEHEVYVRTDILAGTVGTQGAQEDRNTGHFGEVIASAPPARTQAEISDALSLFVEVTCNANVADVFVLFEFRPTVPL